MRIEIDQSGKIADTQVPTVLAFSNGVTHSIFISQNTKRRLIKTLRSQTSSRVLYFQIFSLLIFFLLQNHLKKIQMVFIDEEYEGREGELKGYFLDVCLKNKVKINPKIIHFSQIGKRSNAHKAALAAFRKRKADKEITYTSVINQFFRKKKDRGPHP